MRLQLDVGPNWYKKLELKLVKRAEYHIMSQTVGVNVEPLKWPIAPDGYIPNSVIRSWGRKGKELNFTDCWQDFSYSLHQRDEDTTNEEDMTTRTFWFTHDEEEEEETTDEVKRKKTENEKDEEKMEVEVKKRDEKKMDRIVLVRRPYDTQTKTTLQNHLKTSDDGQTNVEPQRQEVGSTYSSGQTAPVQTGTNFTPTSCFESGPKQLRELREDVTPPLQAYLSVPKKQTPSSFVPKEWLKPPVESPVVSTDTIIAKQEPKNVTPQPLKLLSPNPEDPQLQPVLEPPECPPIRDQRFLLYSTKYSNIRDQEQVPLNRKVLALYKKSKISNKSSSRLGKLSTTAERSPASKATHSTVLTNTGGLNLYGGLYSPPSFSASQTTIQTQPPRSIHPECPSHPLSSDHPAQFAQSFLPFKDQRGHKSMPEWRKSLYKLISLRGFCSPRAARLAATDHLVKSSSARQLAATIFSPQPDQAAAHQRVVQKIQTSDTLKTASLNFHHVIPMASQHSFYTLNPCGRTQCGRLQFDWMRGSEEDKPLRVSAVKTKDTAHRL